MDYNFGTFTVELGLSDLFLLKPFRCLISVLSDKCGRGNAIGRTDNFSSFHECRYIESKPNHWSPKHSVIVKEIENMDKMKMALCVQHTMNHQNYGERNNRMSDLILELKKIFENLGIKYRLLPQEVHLSQANISTPSIGRVNPILQP